tara:strand:+ start:3725 stop:3997 length:273 start_codon:yes stop_codon:yes gene_type:complete
MKHTRGNPRSQTLLLSACVGAYVGLDNVVRFIEAKATGRPRYDLGDLLKLYIYGYLNQVRSSRRLETETHRDLADAAIATGLQSHRRLSA